MTSESVNTSENVEKPENGSQEEGTVDSKAEQDLPVARQALSDEHIQQIIEAALLAAEGPLTVDNLFRLFEIGELDEEEGRKQIRTALQSLEDACENRGVALQKVASGYRYQTRQDLSRWVSRLWEEKPPRYTRALLETLALVAYKQPVTRGDIEQVRGVSVSQNIMRTLLERDWIRVVGQREAPGRPSMYGTTKAFLDYFSLNKLDDLPPMEEIKAMIEPTLAAEDGVAVSDEAGSAPDTSANADTAEGGEQEPQEEQHAQQQEGPQEGQQEEQPEEQQGNAEAVAATVDDGEDSPSTTDSAEEEANNS
jgi:segregation and condensation protein B